MAFYEIPLSPKAQALTVSLPGGDYRLRFVCANVEEGGWIMDIATSADEPLACGIPLVTGADLLGQYGYLNLGGALYVASDGVPDAVPTFANLGVRSHLYFVPSA